MDVADAQLAQCAQALREGRLARSGVRVRRQAVGAAVADELVREPAGARAVVAKPFDNVPIRDLLGEKTNPRQTGGVVDIAPMLGSGTYTCQGTTTLILTPQDSQGLKWTFTKK